MFHKMRKKCNGIGILGAGLLTLASISGIFYAFFLPQRTVVSENADPSVKASGQISVKKITVSTPLISSKVSIDLIAPSELRKESSMTANLSIKNASLSFDAEDHGFSRG